jgi:hypothetical protein
MAGSDTIGPASLCLSIVLRGGVSLLMTAARVCYIIANCQRLSRTRELQWSENTPCAGKPQSWAERACEPHDSQSQDHLGA